jgi:hypothetical protein
MGRYVEGWERRQTFLLPECFDDHVCDDNPVPMVEAFVNEPDLGALGFDRAAPVITLRSC